MHENLEWSSSTTGTTEPTRRRRTCHRRQHLPAEQSSTTLRRRAHKATMSACTVSLWGETSSWTAGSSAPSQCLAAIPPTDSASWPSPCWLLVLPTICLTLQFPYLFDEGGIRFPERRMPTRGTAGSRDGGGIDIHGRLTRCGCRGHAGWWSAGNPVRRQQLGISPAYTADQILSCMQERVTRGVARVKCGSGCRRAGWWHCGECASERLARHRLRDWRRHA